MTHHPPSRELNRTDPDMLASPTLPGLGPSSIATIPVVPGKANTLIGLLAYVMLSPPPSRGPHGEPLRLTPAQVQNGKDTLAYLTTRADALCRSGRGRLVDEAATERARHARASDDPYVPPARSYVGGTVRDAVGYLCPVIAEEAGRHRGGNGSGTGPQQASPPGPPAEPGV